MKLGRLNLGNSSALPALMLFWALVAPASILYYLGIKGLYSTLFALIAALIIGMISRKQVRISAIIIAACLILISWGNVLHWNDARYLFYGVFFLCALTLVELSGIAGIEKFCTLATSLMIILLIGAVASFVFAQLGTPPLFTITNPDGQDYFFFYTGFTNSYSDNFIRASAIYDEPGAFSMYICFVAAMRHLLSRDRKATWLILILGFVTFSLAHLIYVICHFLAEQASNRRLMIVLGILASALFVLITSMTLDSDIVLLSRLALTEDANMFAGDNRSFQLFNAWSNITDSPSSILFGLDNSCVFSQLVCQEKFGAMGENLLSPLAFGGVLSEMPYYFTIFIFLIAPAFGRRYIVIFGMGLLFLQRPYVTGFSYALIAVLLLDLLFRRDRTLSWNTAKVPKVLVRPLAS